MNVINMYILYCPHCGSKSIPLDVLKELAYKYGWESERVKDRHRFKCPDCGIKIVDGNFWSNTCTECKHAIPKGEEHWVGHAGISGVAHLCPKCLDDPKVRRFWYGLLGNRKRRRVKRKSRSKRDEDRGSRRSVRDLTVFSGTIFD